MAARLTAFLAAGIVFLALAVPAPAGAATVGDQVERSAPARLPTDLHGCRPACRRGSPIPRGHVLLSRIVRLEPGESRVPISFLCPKRHRIQTVGFLDRIGADIAFQVAENQLPYRHRRSLRGTAERILQPLSAISRGTTYVLCRRSR